MEFTVKAIYQFELISVAIYIHDIKNLYFKKGDRDQMVR